MRTRVFLPLLAGLLACVNGERPGESPPPAAEALSPAHGPLGLELPNLDPCNEVELALTAAEGESWSADGMTFDGHLSVYLCSDDLERLHRRAHARMHAVLDELVPEHHFRMLPICIDLEGPGSGALYAAERRELLARLNAASGGVVRRVRCRFGWTHY